MQQPVLPECWTVRGELSESMSEDMLEAECQGILICAGWSEEKTPDGFYRVTVTRGTEVLEAAETMFPKEAVEFCAKRYGAS